MKKLRYTANTANKLKLKGFELDTKVSGIRNYEVWKKESEIYTIDHDKKRLIKE